jgi:hypothetical protein
MIARIDASTGRLLVAFFPVQPEKTTNVIITKETLLLPTFWTNYLLPSVPSIKNLLFYPPESPYLVFCGVKWNESQRVIVMVVGDMAALSNDPDHATNLRLQQAGFGWAAAVAFEKQPLQQKRGACHGRQPIHDDYFQ